MEQERIVMIIVNKIDFPEAQFLMEQRAVSSSNAGEIIFPGGKAENDETLIHAVSREAR